MKILYKIFKKLKWKKEQRHLNEFLNFSLNDTWFINISIKYVYMSKLLSKEKLYFNWHKSRDTSYGEHLMENSSWQPAVFQSKVNENKRKDFA